MADRRTRIVLDDFSGGRNGADPPLGPTFAENQVVDAVNVDWYRTSGLRKRHGSANISMTGSGMVGQVSWLGRHVPSTVEADAELWAVDEASPATFTRLDNSATWASPGASVDVPTAASSPWDMTCCSLNGLFFIAYNSGVARLHCWDATTNSIRRTGISPGSNAPTAADTGSGSYAATLRYYRVRWQLTSVAGFVRSEATPSVAFTPSGSGTHARVTKPATPSDEGIVTWFVEASADNITFYIISVPMVVATTTFDDNFTVASYSGGLFVLSALTGTHTLQKSYKFIAADQNRLLGFGSYTSADKQSRIELSAVVGSLDIGDAERVDTTDVYYYDLDEKDSGVPTALVGPLWGNFYAFKTRQIWELSPTGSVSSPYRLTPISKELGAVQSHAACVGEDPQGNPCLYFMSHRGMYRYGLGGLVYVGRGIEDLILGPTSTMNMAATKVISHLVYHPDRRQVWVWFAVGSSNEADTLCVLNVMTNGWARYTGTIAQARCSTMFARSIGATMGFQLCPYIGSSTAVNRVTRCDDTSVTQDASVSYQAYITTKPIEPGGPGFFGTCGDPQLLAPAASGVTITATMTPDFGASATKTGTAVLNAVGSETRLLRRMVDAQIGHVQFLQVVLGDAVAANNTWTVDRMLIPVQPAEAVS